MLLKLLILFALSYLDLSLLFIVDWLMDLPTLLLACRKKMKSLFFINSSPNILF